MKNNITKSFISRFFIYLKERFPFTQMIPLSLIVGLNVVLFNQLISSISARVVINVIFEWSFVSLGLYLFLLRLRLWDEAKDAEHDKLYYPQRPVPRGLVSLRELQRSSWVVLALELVLVAVVAHAWLPYLIALGYSILLRYEFGVRKWLRQHFTTYMVLHELLVIPLIIYLSSLTFFSFSWMSEGINNWPWSIFVYAILLFIAFFILEIGRKFRVKAEEIQSKDTYTSRYGTTKTSWLLVGLLLLLSMGLFVLCWFSSIFWLPVLPVFLLSLVSLLQFHRQPTIKKAKQVFYGLIAFVTTALLMSAWLWWGV